VINNNIENMKFKNYLTAIDHVSIYPLISLVLFVVFFAGVLVYTIKMSKSQSEEHSRLPLN